MINLIYIPQIHVDYDDEFIRKIFTDLNLGIIENIYSFNTLTNRSQYYSAMICFSYWNTNNPAAVNLAEKILDEELEARLIYDDPKYWVLLPNFHEKYIEQEVDYEMQHIDIYNSTSNHNHNSKINSLTLQIDKLSEENIKLENKIKELERKITSIKRAREREQETSLQRFDKKYCVIGGGRLSSVSNWHTNPKIVRNFVIHKEFKKPAINIPTPSIGNISESITMKSGGDKDIYKKAHYWCSP